MLQHRDALKRVQADEVFRWIVWVNVDGLKGYIFFLHEYAGFTHEGRQGSAIQLEFHGKLREK